MQDSFEYKRFQSQGTITKDPNSNTFSFKYETRGKNAVGEDVAFKTSAHFGDNYIEFEVSKEDPISDMKKFLIEEIKKKIDESSFEDTHMRKMLK